MAGNKFLQIPNVQSDITTVQNVTTVGDRETLLQISQVENNEQECQVVMLGDSNRFMTAPGTLYTESNPVQSCSIDYGVYGNGSIEKDPVFRASPAFLINMADISRWNNLAAGSVSGPSTSINDDIVLFSGISGDIIKDSGFKLSNFASSSHTHSGVYQPVGDYALNSALTSKVDKVTGYSLVENAKIALIHAQNTDTFLDQGGANEVSALQAKTAYTHSQSAHAPSNAVSLATVKGDSEVANAIALAHASGSDDETTLSIKTKLGTSSISTDGYLTSTDFNTFNSKANALGADDNYVTDTEKAALHSHSNKTALDAVSGTNTGDNAANTTSNTYADGKVANSITDGVLTIAPSQNAVFDALTLKENVGVAASLDATVLLSANSYADNLVVGLWDDRGSFDASVNTYPTTGGSGTAGAILKGDIWTLSVIATSGPLIGYTMGTTIRALVNTPAQTGSNWALSGVGLGYSPENAANKVTSVSVSSTDIQYPSAKLLYDQLILKSSDIHSNITALNAVTNVNTGDQDLSGLVVKNASITGGTKTKITYDAKGLVTSGADATTADIAASTNKNYVTDAQLTVIGNTSGVNSGNQALTIGGSTSPTISLSGSNTATFVGAGSVTLGQTGGTITITGGTSMTWPAAAGIAIYNGSNTWGTSITDNSTNWNTAFGWGNHASAGYASASGYIPYTGGTSNVNLIHNLIVDTTTLFVDSTNHRVGFGTVTPVSKFDIKSTATQDAPTLSEEFLSGSGWTSTGWTGSWAGGWVHTTGNTSALSYATAAVSATKYILTYEVVSRTVGSFAIAFGGQTISSQTTSDVWGPTSSSTGVLTITPTADFNGTITISIKSIVAVRAAMVSYIASDDAVIGEIRIDKANPTNQFNGYGSGRYNVSGVNNTGYGYLTLSQVTTGSNNTGVGREALRDVTTGDYNMALGNLSGTQITTGSRNIGVGTGSIYSVTTGSYNIGIGYNAVRNNVSALGNVGIGYYSLIDVTGNYNTGIGYYALGALGNATYNVGIGYQAGRFIADGATSNSTGTNSVFLGGDARPLANGENNQIVIGYNAIGNGANTTTIGNTSILRTYLTGLNLKAGTATAGTAALKFTSGATLTAAEAGAVEWDGTNLFITQTTGPSRKTIAYTTDITSQVYPSAGIALSTGSAWGTSITDNSANWNTAYGWGNHATSGYLTSLTGAVLTDQTTGQTIGATGTRLTKLWATDITVTNAITGSITGNAGTVTNGVYTTGAGIVYLAPTGSAAGLTSFPTFNQSTTGSAATLTTPRAIYGNNFDGSAALTQIIASTYGGTGNGFAKFSGPTTSEKTFTLPNASATLLYSGGALGTPSSGTATNLTGTASGLTAGTVTNATFTTAFTNNGGAGILAWPAAGATLTIPTGGGTLGTAAFTATTAYAAALSGTNNTIAYFNSTTTIASLSTGTYPSLTELSYVKGVTSAIQTQLGTMLLKAGGTMTGDILGSVSYGSTGTRITKLWATDIESTNAPTVGGVVVPTISSTSTLTNKRINPRLVTTTSYTTDTGTSLDVSVCDQFEITAQAGALLFNSPGGTPLGGQKLLIRIKDDGTARALTYNAIFRAAGNALPSTTVLSKTLYMGFIYNATDTKWDLVAVSQEA